MLNRLLKYCAALLPLASCSVAAMGEVPLFASQEPFKAVLMAPIGQAYAQKDKEKRLYLEGKWSYRDGADTVALPVKIRTRGNSRRRLCKLPPLQLNFRKGELDGTLFAGQNKLKMVSPCSTGDNYQQLVYLELLVYQFYALVSEQHFITRPVEVSYVDSESGKTWSSTNFLLESENGMALRLGMKTVDVESTPRSSMNLAETALLEVFQFVIGNEDYSSLKSPPGKSCCHNVVPLASGEALQGLIPVAYDFDSSGIIGAPYATPPQGIPINHVSRRYFMGWCKEEHRYRDAIERLNRVRDEAVGLFTGSDLLTDKNRKRAVKYLEKSFKLINDEDYVEDKIIGRCRGEVIKG